jgi:hypothetical protein
MRILKIKINKNNRGSFTMPYQVLPCDHILPKKNDVDVY